MARLSSRRRSVGRSIGPFLEIRDRYFPSRDGNDRLQLIDDDDDDDENDDGDSGPRKPPDSRGSRHKEKGAR